MRDQKAGEHIPGSVTDWGDVKDQYAGGRAEPL